MEMKRIFLVLLVTLCLICAATFQVAQARTLVDRAELNEAADWLPGESQEELDDFGVGEGRVAEIIAAAEAEKLKIFTGRGNPNPDRKTPYDQLDEIDRLKLSINKIICDSMEEGCDHMDDMQDTPLEHPEEIFASLKPDEYVKDVE